MATKKVNIDTNLFVLSGQDDGFDPFGWYNLPDCTQNDNEAPYIMTIKIASKAELDKFADLIQQPLLKAEGKLKTKSIWYPILIQGERGSSKKYVWMDQSTVDKYLERT